MAPVTPPSLLRIGVSFAIVYLVWGSTYLAIRYAVDTIPPFLMAAVRFLIAGGLMYAYLWWKGNSQLSGRQWFAAGKAGTLMLVGGNGLVCWAEQFVPSGIAALIVGSAPIWIVSLEWLFFGGQRPTLLVTLGLVLGLAGVALLTGVDQWVDTEVTPTAAFALMAACFFWAWGSLLTKSPQMPRSAPLSVAVQMLVGGAALLLVSVLLNEPLQFAPSDVSIKSLLSLLYLIFFGAILAFTCYNWLFRVCKPAHAATYAYVNPIVAVFLGYALANEPIRPRTIYAAALIVCGVILVSLRGRKPPKSAGQTSVAPLFESTSRPTLREAYEIATEDAEPRS